jgi:SAM-dependent methyltransferase
VGVTDGESLDRLESLLTPDAAARARRRSGWLDVLAEPTEGDQPTAASAPTTVARRLMESTAVPLVYTRYWRPMLGRVAKGLGGPSMAEEFVLARDLLALRSGDVVLDLGCGPGTFTRRFAAAVAPDGLAIGLDASESMLRRARIDGTSRSAPPVYLRADAEQPPLRPGTLDAVCCFAALHMLEHPMRALGALATLLRPGGRIALLTSARRPGPLGLADEVLGRVSGQHMFSRTDMVERLEELGFVGIEQTVAGVTQFVGGRRRAGPP